MIEKINDIKAALLGKAYQSALSMALTLPAICAEVEFGNSQRLSYKTWCDNNIPKSAFSFCIPDFSDNEVTGELLYQLRCSVLHAGTSDVEKKYGIILDNFSFWIPGPASPTYGYEYQQKDVNGQKILTTKIDLVYLVETICDAAETFYNNWNNKTDFDTHKIKIEIR